MNNFKILLTLFVFILFTNCKKYNSNSIHLRIESPSEMAVVNPIGVTLEWQSDVFDSSKIVFSEDVNFNNVYAEFTTFENSLSVPVNFQPKKIYYWKVIQGVESATSKFVVKDVFENRFFSGKHLAKFYKYNWSMNGGVTNEIHFTDSVLVEKKGDNILVKYTPENIDNTLLFNSYNSNNTIFYLTSFFGSSGCGMNYDYINNKVGIFYRTGGLGGGTEIQIEY